VLPPTITNPARNQYFIAFTNYSPFSLKKQKQIIHLLESSLFLLAIFIRENYFCTPITHSKPREE